MQVQLLTSELQLASQLAAEWLSTIHELQSQSDEVEEAQGNAGSTSQADVEDMCGKSQVGKAGYLRELETKNARLTSEVHHLKEREESVEVLRKEVFGSRARGGGGDARICRPIGIQVGCRPRAPVVFVSIIFVTIFFALQVIRIHPRPHRTLPHQLDLRRM